MKKPFQILTPTCYKYLMSRYTQVSLALLVVIIWGYLLYAPRLVKRTGRAGLVPRNTEWNFGAAARGSAKWLKHPKKSKGSNLETMFQTKHGEIKYKEYQGLEKNKTEVINTNKAIEPLNTQLKFRNITEKGVLQRNLTEQLGKKVKTEMEPKGLLKTIRREKSLLKSKMVKDKDTKSRLGMSKEGTKRGRAFGSKREGVMKTQNDVTNGKYSRTPKNDVTRGKGETTSFGALQSGISKYGTSGNGTSKTGLGFTINSSSTYGKIPKWLKNCKAFYLDLGSGNGSFIQKLYTFRRNATTTKLGKTRYSAVEMQLNRYRIKLNQTKLEFFRKSLCTLAFEPNPFFLRPLKSLAKSLNIEGYRVKVFPLAVTSKNGNVQLFTKTTPSPGNERSSSLIRPSIIFNVQEVKGVSLAKFINSILSPKHIPVIRMDIVGAEYDVLNDLYSKGLLCQKYIQFLSAKFNKPPVTTDKNLSKLSSSKAIVWKVQNQRGCKPTKIHTIRKSPQKRLGRLNISKSKQLQLNRTESRRH